MNLQTEIAGKSVDFTAIADSLAAQPERMSEALAGLKADKARVKYGCLKLLRLLSERNPAALYPSLKEFVGLLDSDNTILKWGAIIIIGNLAAVDAAGQIDRILDRYLQPISGHVMITAANVIRGAGKIAAAKPELADEIARSILRVQAAEYQTEECRNVAIGHAIESLELFADRIENLKPVKDFVERQLGNSRNAVRRKAARFLKALSSDRGKNRQSQLRATG